MNISPHDRGFNYGDGVFETLLVDDGRPVWWEAHLERLHRGCEALGIEVPALPDLPRAPGRAALKLVVTRGVGGRGYAPVDAGEATVVVTAHPAPPVPAAVAARWCELRLAQQPRLAGHKHLNRLENVLARGEWSDPAIGEGLLCDVDGRVVCATAANLFVVRAGRLLTPALDRCGVAGVARRWVMEAADVEVATLYPEDIEGADELFLTNSLRGILPVARLGRLEWKPGPMTRRLQDRLWAEVPALEPRP